MIRPSIYAPHFGNEQKLQSMFAFKQHISLSFDTVKFDPSATLKVFIQCEPTAVKNSMDDLIIQNQHSFDVILTYKKNVLAACDNAIFFPFGTCWIEDGDRKIYKKNSLVSIVASSKNYTTGHRLRHVVIKKHETLDCYGRGYNPVESKITALKDYMFSVAIENSTEDNYFTEKLIDCMVTGVVPIYWGCDNISDFFDPRGILKFSNEDQLSSIMGMLSEEVYNKMKPYIEYNYNIAKRYTEFYDRITEIINKEIS